MRRICFGVALSAVLTGSLASIANSQTDNPPKSPIPPGLAKDCAAQTLKDSPNTKFVGPFSQFSYKNPLTTSFHEGKFLAIAAPARTPGFMDRIVKHYMGCIYDLRDGKPVLQKLIPQTALPPRYKTEPGEE